VADPIEAGTPQAKPPDSESAGTGGQAADGSESAGKPVDPALAMAWKAKAEEGNRALSRVQELEARLAAIQNQQYAQQQQANPLAEMVAELQQQAPYDVNAKAALASLTIQATQQAEMDVLRTMMRLNIPPARQDMVASIVRNSGYRVGVEAADQMARGSEVPDLAKQLEAERQKRMELEKVLNARTAGGSTQGNPATTTPAATSADGALEVTLEEYRHLPREARDKAKIKQ
jgi:hypothetical protein